MVGHTGISRFAAVMAAAVLLVAGLVALGPSPASASASAPAGTFVPVTPVRVMDSSRGLGAGAPGPHAATHLDIGTTLVPSTAVAVAATVSVIAPKAAGYLTVYNHAAARPATSNVVFAAGVNQADQVYVPGHGDMDIYNGSTGAVRILVDVTGYFAAAASAPAGAYVPVTPQRIVDTRNGVGGHAVAAHSTATVQLPAGTVPAGVSAVAVTLDALQPTAAGYLTAYATGTTRPGTSNVNFAAKQSVADMVVAGVSGARFTVYNGSAGSVQLVLDLQGYYVAGAATAGGAYVPIGPARILASGTTLAQERYVGGTNYNGNYPSSVLNDSVPLVTLTASGVQANGYAVLYAGDRPAVETESVTRGLVTAGLTQAPEATEVFNGTNASLRFTIDVSGFYLGPKGLGAIAGHVTDATSHAGLGGVVVVVYQASTEDGETAYFEYSRTTTAADGSYALTRIDAGDGDVFVCFDALAAPQPDPATGHGSQCYDDLPWTQPGRGFAVPPSSPAPTPVPLSTTTTTTVDAALTRTPVGTLTGRVTTNGGGGVGDVLVTIDRTDGLLGTDVHTTASGSYSVALPTGTYKVCFDASTLPNSAAAPYGYDASCAATNATVTAGKTSTRNGVVQKLGGITWPVTTSTGKAPANGNIRIFDSTGAQVPLPGGGSRNTSTDPYTETGLEPGEYTVCSDDHSGFDGEPGAYENECYNGVLWSPRFTSSPPAGTTLVEVKPAVITRVPPVVVSAAGAISGGVTAAATGDPVGNATVTAYDATGNEFQITGTDGDGDYRLGGLPASSSGYSVCFAPSANPPTSAKPQCYRGIVWDGTGKPPAGVTSVSVTSGQTHTGIDAALTG